MIITKCTIGLTQNREQTEIDSKHKVPTLRAEKWCKTQNAPTPCFFLYFKHFHLTFIFKSVTFGHLYYESATFSVRGNPKEIYQVRQIFLILTKVLHTPRRRQINSLAPPQEKTTPRQDNIKTWQGSWHDKTRQGTNPNSNPDPDPNNTKQDKA